MTTISWDKRGVRVVDGIPDDARWQPIETAPKDGTRLLLANTTGKLADGVWSTRYEVWSWPYMMTEPTHWMPLPAKPD